MRHHGSILLALILAGCASENMPALEPGNPPPAATAKVSCEGPMARQCKFINSPVKLSSRPLRLPDGPYPFFRTKNTLEFVNAEGKVWIAPAGILTDGASIPPMFVAFIGSPRSREFLNAATVHDSYCAESNKNGPYYHTAPWQDVHRMLYDALLVSGTSPIKAKIMYAAVYLGGPRWKGVRTPPRRKAGMEAHGGQTVIAPAGYRRQSDVPLPRLFSKDQLIAAFKRAKAHIEANNPSINALDGYLEELESELSASLNPPKQRRNFTPRQHTGQDYLDEMGDKGGVSGDVDVGNSEDGGYGGYGGGGSLK